MFFSGRVQSVKFQNEDMYVLVMLLDGGQEVTCKGNVFGLTIREGVWFGFDGHWETHPKYGRQLAMDRAPQAPQGLWAGEMCAGMLRSAGVPDPIVDELFKTFGNDLSRVLLDERALIRRTALIPTEIEHIQKAWKRMCGIFETMERLETAGFSRYTVRQMWAKFDDLSELLTSNPWRLLEISGVTLEQVDQIAIRFAIPLTCPARITGVILSALRQGQMVGHVHLPLQEVVSSILGNMQTQVTPKEISNALEVGQRSGLMILDQKTKPGMVAVYSPWLHTVETVAVSLLKERLEKASPSQTILLNVKRAQATSICPTTPEEWRQLVLGETGTSISLSEEQLQGAVMALQEPVCVVTGLPGTGKTTLLKVVSRMLVDFGAKVLLIAPTGIAAKRMSHVTGLPAQTIHRAFGALSKAHMQEITAAEYGGVFLDDEDMDSTSESLGEWRYTPEHPHEADVVFVDEASMVDAHLLYRILISTKSTCRLVFIGDVAQLPSVGPGQILSDMIRSGFFPVVSLREVFRQHEQSGIIRAAHAIVRGDIPVMEEVGKDFVFIPLDSEDEILSALLRVVEALFQRRSEFQVLSPRHGGTLGVINLNECLRTLLNPKQAHLTEFGVGKHVLRQGDRVMVTKNDYMLGVYNGDVGKISDIVRMGKKFDPFTVMTSRQEDNSRVEVKLYGSTSVMQIPLNKAHLLRLAYAMTVHKSQGQEYDNILLPWVRGFGPQLERNLLYTAITRAKKKVYLFGHPQALARAIQTAKGQVRHTLFVERMCVDGNSEGFDG